MPHIERAQIYIFRYINRYIYVWIPCTPFSLAACLVYSTVWPKIHKWPVGFCLRLFFTLLDKHKRYLIHSIPWMHLDNSWTGTTGIHTRTHTHTHILTISIDECVCVGHEIILKRPQNDFIQLKCQNAVCFRYLMQ